MGKKIVAQTLVTADHRDKLTEYMSKSIDSMRAELDKRFPGLDIDEEVQYQPVIQVNGHIIHNALILYTHDTSTAVAEPNQPLNLGGTL